jgi:hypothetical protein
MGNKSAIWIVVFLIQAYLCPGQSNQYHQAFPKKSTWTDFTKIQTSYTFISKQNITNSFPGAAFKATPRPWDSPYEYLQEVGFICKWEYKLDRKWNRAVRLRLGSSEYTDRLENKIK